MPCIVDARIDRSLLLVLGVILSLAFTSTLPGQDSAPRRESETKETRWVRDAVSPSVNPHRIEETVTRIGDRTLRTTVLQTPSPDGRLTDSVIVEEETIRLSATKSRRVQKLFNRSDGRRVLVEILEEEIVEQSGGTRTATRLTSKPDVNGNLRVTRREADKTVQRGPDASTTESTVFLPSVNGGFESVSQTRRTESRDQEGSRKIDQEQFVHVGDADTWQLQERITRVVEEEGEVEDVFRVDSQGELPLSQRSITRRWKDPDGQRHEVTEVHSRSVEGLAPSFDNELRLVRRTTVRLTPQAGQGTRTVTEVEQRRVADPRNSLQTVERIVEVSSPDGRTHQEIQTIDGGGTLRASSVIESRKTVQPASAQRPE